MIYLQKKGNFMGHLIGISFAGIDMRTNTDELVRIHEKCTVPDFVEFGILLSQNWQKNGNRYFDPDQLRRFRGSGLNLCTHLCGSIAREAVRGNWIPFFYLVGDNVDLFKRVQLNIAGYKDSNPDILDIILPDPVKEVIIQQKAAYDCKLFYEWKLRHPGNTTLSVLIDGSGGMGIDTTVVPLPDVDKVGYAGGIGPDNVFGKVSELIQKSCVRDFWIDMESKIRTEDDWFDINKAEVVMQKTSIFRRLKDD